jgi:AcrR family transcriptional regulator
VTVTRNAPRRAGEHRTSPAVRERILAAAFEVVSKYGYNGTTVAKVAAKAGLPVGSVYWHYENKDQLLVALIEDSYERWHSQIGQYQQPLPGETFEQHVYRVFCSPASRPYFAADFWRLGVILSVEKSVPEQAARKRFLKIRELQREELTSWWQRTLPPETLEKDPELPNRLSRFTLALQDGNAIAGSSGESVDDFHRMLAASLLHLARNPLLGDTPPAPDTASRPRTASRSRASAA